MQTRETVSRFPGRCKHCSAPFGRGDVIELSVPYVKGHTYLPGHGASLPQPVDNDGPTVVLQEEPEVPRANGSGAQPARTILSVEGEGVYLEGGFVVTLEELTRAELHRAAKVRFPETNGQVWIKLTNADIRTAIRTGEAPEGAPAKAAPKVKAPKVEAGGSSVEEAIKALVAATATKAEVDEDRVREIAAEVAAEHVRPIHVVATVKGVESGEHVLPETAHPLLPEILVCVSQGCNVLLVGPAGSGKSTLAYQVAEIKTPGRFGSISLGPTTSTAKFFGFVDAHGNPRSTPFSECVVNGGGFLCDELDNGHPGLVAELNQVLANGHGAFAWGVEAKHADFFFIGTANTFGRGPDRKFVGRNILDFATLDRFVTIEVPVDEDLEWELVTGKARARKAPEAIVPLSDDAAAPLVKAWVTKVQRARQKAQDLKLPVVVSPRASIEGARLIRAGLSPDRVAEIRLFAGIDHDTRRKLEG